MTKSIGRFQEAFNKVIEEDSSTAVALGGSPEGFDPAAGRITSSDAVYAPKDVRIATPDGVIQKRTGAIKLKSKRTRKQTKRRTQKRGTTAL
jgi:hypothetical protein